METPDEIELNLPGPVQCGPVLACIPKAELSALKSALSEAQKECERLQASYDSTVREVSEFNKGHECKTYGEAQDIGEFACMGFAWRHFDHREIAALRARAEMAEEIAPRLRAGHAWEDWLTRWDALTAPEKEG